MLSYTYFLTKTYAVHFINHHALFTGLKGHVRFVMLFDFCVSFVLIVFELF